MENLSEILPPGLLSTKEVADRLGISIAKVHRLVLKSQLHPAFKLDGQTGRYYFKADDIDAYREKEAS
jgi:excisionase family DNA binding protein